MRYGEGSARVTGRTTSVSAVDAAAVTALCAAFPGVRTYHASLVRTASGGSGRVRTLAGRCHVTKLRAVPSERERAAAQAALLGDVCRASAADVSSLLLATLASHIAADGLRARDSAEALRPTLLMHTPDEVLFEVSPVAAGDADAGEAARAALERVLLTAAHEVEHKLALSVTLDVTVTMQR